MAESSGAEGWIRTPTPLRAHPTFLSDSFLFALQSGRGIFSCRDPAVMFHRDRARATLRAWYSATTSEFHRASFDAALGQLTSNSGFAVSPTQRDRWLAVIEILQDQPAGDRRRGMQPTVQGAPEGPVSSHSR